MKLLLFFIFLFFLRSPGGRAQELDELLTLSNFNRMLPHRDDANCPASGFYTYRSFITAAESFPGFGKTGDNTTRKRELAAFFGQTSHETTGGWPGAPDGPYAWGYCFYREQGNPPDYCAPSAMWPCASGKKYYGRGPMQISYNYNYGAAGQAIGVDLLSNPDLVLTDPVVSFKTAIWFWMTPQPPKPSPHDVIVGRWQPENRDRHLALDITISLKKASWLRMTPQSSRPSSSSSDDIIIGRWQPANRDIEAGEIAGYGIITSIIDGGVECGKGTVDPRSSDRIGYYKRYCDILGVSYGENLDCLVKNGTGTKFRASLLKDCI